jgi:hypothetical protein
VTLLAWILFPPQVVAVDASGGGGIDLAVFANYGVVGVVAAILIWFAKGAHQRERDRGDRLEGELQRLHEVMMERVIPALSAATRTAEESASLLASMQRERELTQIVKQQRREAEGGS